VKYDLKNIRQEMPTFAGALLFSALAIARLEYAIRHADWMGLLLTAQAVIAVILLVRRSQAQTKAPLYQRLVAWGSAFLPLAMETANALWIGKTLTAAGLALCMWGFVMLGRSFGVSPADRGLVQRGPYRWLRHPIYAGELLAIAGAVMGDRVGAVHWTLRNLTIFAVLLATKLLRIRWEERIIQGYPDYSARVRWRLVPGVW
ncbi:MAG: hypothetical protein KJ606_01690, partial [Chloroflexi bacterium]|nr:hypothetical protein [Chloroflexota bacterium]